MPELPSPSRTRGTAALAVGVVALVAYAVLGGSPESPDLPAAQLALAALLVILGGAIRQGRAPTWGEYAAAALAAYLAFDLVIRLFA